MHRPNKANKYQSTLTVVVLLLIVWLINDIEIIAQIGLGIGFLALVSSEIAMWIDAIWTKILTIIGWINSRVLLSLVFFLILAPIAFFYRIFKGDTLNLKGGKSSYFIDRNHLYKAEDLKNPW